MSGTRKEPVVMLNDSDRPIGLLEMSEEGWAIFEKLADYLVIAPITADGKIVGLSLQPLALTGPAITRADENDLLRAELAAKGARLAELKTENK